ncbi:MAG: type II secretion system protein GspD [Candidatus Omnitrophota bacterium]
MKTVERNSYKFLVLFLSIWLSLGFPAYSETVDPSAAGIEVQKTGTGLMNLDFKGAALINVLGALSEVSGMNFVAGQEIADRKVNMSLDNIDLEKTLNALSRGCNVTFEYIPQTKIYLFRATADTPGLAPMFTRVLKLKYLRASEIREIDAGESSSGGAAGLATLDTDEDSTGSAEGKTMAIVKIVEGMLSDRGKVSVDDRSNSLVVTDSEDRLGMVEKAVEELDKPLKQVLISVILVETYEDLDRELGIEWANTATADGSWMLLTGGTSATSFPFNYAKFWKEHTGWEGLDPEPNLTTLALSGDEVKGTKDFSRLTMEVKALQEASKLKILAKPRILVLDNHPALIKISTSTAVGSIVTASNTTAQGGSTGINTAQAERAEIGTILRVTPQINDKKKVTLTIEPTFATVAESSIISDTGDPTVRAARTTLMVNDRETLVLGGLLFSNQELSERRVPLLGDIPLLGRAFRNEQKIIRDRELILFMTPEIISDPSELKTTDIPDRESRFEDEMAAFWKFKRKNWYKQMTGKKAPPKEDFEDYYKVMRGEMDAMAKEVEKK